MEWWEQKTDWGEESKGGEEVRPGNIDNSFENICHTELERHELVAGEHGVQEIFFEMGSPRMCLYADGKI